MSSSQAKIEAQELPDGAERYILSGDWRNHSISPVLKTLDHLNPAPSDVRWSLIAGRPRRKRAKTGLRRQFRLLGGM